MTKRQPISAKIEMRRYRAKPNCVAAFQYNGTVEQAKLLAGADGAEGISVDTTDGKFNGSVSVRTHDNTITKAKASDYIVIAPDGQMSVYDPRAFSLAFEEDA